MCERRRRRAPQEAVPGGVLLISRASLPRRVCRRQFQCQRRAAAAGPPSIVCSARVHAVTEPVTERVSALAWPGLAAAARPGIWPDPASSRTLAWTAAGPCSLGHHHHLQGPKGPQGSSSFPHPAKSGTAALTQRRARHPGQHWPATGHWATQASWGTGTLKPGHTGCGQADRAAPCKARWPPDAPVIAAGTKRKVRPVDRHPLSNAATCTDWTSPPCESQSQCRPLAVEKRFALGRRRR